MRVWNLTSDPPVELVPTRHYRGAAFSPDGRLLAAAGGEANTLWTLDGATPQFTAELGTGRYDDLPPSFSPDSKFVAWPGIGATIWNLSLPKPQMVFESDYRYPRFAPQVQTVLGFNGSGLFSRTWEITKRGQFRLGSEVTVIGKTPDGIGRTLRSLRPEFGQYVNAQNGGKLQVWSLKDNSKPLFEVRHPDLLQAEDFALSDDGGLLAAFTPSGKNVVWDLTKTPPREYVLSGTSHANIDGFFTPDDKLLIVAHVLGIDIHDWAAGRMVWQFRFGRVTGLSRHPDGRHLATVNGNGTIYILRLPELADHSKQ